MIQLVKEFGFCHGVQAAVDKANAADGGVYLYGDLANNQVVMQTFKEKGFIVTEDIDAISNGSTVIIRAHGVPKAIYTCLAEKNITVQDCTCPKVKNIHKIVEEKSNNGYRVIIIGKNGHPEVVGTFGWCKEGTAIIAETEADLDVSFATQPTAVVAQTTCKKSWWDKAVAIIKSQHPTAEIFDTLCNVTSRRIADATETAKMSDVMIIVGDEQSANSQELYHSCKAVCENTFLVTDLEMLIEINDQTKFLVQDATIGLAGSASAPAEIIKEIYDYLIFLDFLSVAKYEIEKNADNCLKVQIESIKSKPFVSEAIASLHDQNQNGKRVRGAMIKLGAEIAGAENIGNYLPIATAYEIFQTAILIHDDIIDKSATRRGKKTIHVAQEEKKLQQGRDKDEAMHFGMSQAICIGDYGLFMANKILFESDIEPHMLIKILQLFSHIQLTTLEGEIMDTTLPYEPIDIAADYEAYTNIVNKIFEHKTAWYTLVGPMMLGATYGGGSMELTECLRDITLPLGIAFQIKDDLLGIYASEKIIGKDATVDLVEKKQTLLYGYAYKHANPTQRQQLDANYGNPAANLAALETVREIFTTTGAREFAENEIRRLSAIGLKLIDHSNFHISHQSLLRGLISHLTTRIY